jgi:hypothetical protein
MAVVDQQPGVLRVLEDVDDLFPLGEESTATISIRGVITSATVVSASEKTPSSMSRSAGPAWRG